MPLWNRESAGQPDAGLETAAQQRQPPPVQGQEGQDSAPAAEPSAGDQRRTAVIPAGSAGRRAAGMGDVRARQDGGVVAAGPRTAPRPPGPPSRARAAARWRWPRRPARRAARSWSAGSAACPNRSRWSPRRPPRPSAGSSLGRVAQAVEHPARRPAAPRRRPAPSRRRNTADPRHPVRGAAVLDPALAQEGGERRQVGQPQRGQGEDHPGDPQRRPRPCSQVSLTEPSRCRRCPRTGTARPSPARGRRRRRRRRPARAASAGRCRSGTCRAWLIVEKASSRLMCRSRKQNSAPTTAVSRPRARNTCEIAARCPSAWPNIDQ